MKVKVQIISASWKRNIQAKNKVLLFSSAAQRAVCHCEAVPGEEHWPRVCRQVHQKAPKLDQLSWGPARGDRAGGGDPAADPAPQHCHATRRLREPHRCGAHPGAVSRPPLWGAAAAAACKARDWEERRGEQRG